MTAVYVSAGAAALIAIMVAISYNRFVAQRNLIRDSWANVDTELRRRYDLVPNLVETVKGYAAHERAVMDAVTAARASAIAQTGAADAQAQTENVLVGALRQLLAVAENYPDLKASAGFLELQRELANTEDRIQTARRFYNGNVRELNRRVQAFPSMILARLFGFAEARYFEIEAAVRAAPAVDLGASPPEQ